jgi:hypothetical protein
MAGSVIVTPNSIVLMIVSATKAGRQAVTSGKGHLGGVELSVGTRIVTHRGPTSPKRHGPQARISANQGCALVCEEPYCFTED